MSDAKALFPALASITASALLIRSIANDFIPHEVLNFFYSGIHNISRKFSSQCTVVIEEFQGKSRNQVYDAAVIYLGTKASLSAQRVKTGKSEDYKKLAFSIDGDEEVFDVYEDVQVRWKHICVQVKFNGIRVRRDFSASLRSEARSYELTFHKKHKEKIFKSYFPYIMERAKSLKQEHRTVKLHTVKRGSWDRYGVNFGHKMTFETLAMDAELKKELVDDLDRFVTGKEFYRRTGKAWKRGYLLYGPPGTGKSSLIAAMANYLNYDIYDLDLTAIHSNMDLKALLLAMSNRSILVLEDIDCTTKLQNQEANDEPVNNGDKKVTLSGLLNVIDGLWSCCGEERIIVFTTNHKDRLDPALLRPGRMDMQIHMSYCTPSAFEQLAFNYLGISQHNLFEQIEELLEKVEVTPAEIAGELTRTACTQDSLPDLIKFLHGKKMQQEKAKRDQNAKEDHEREKEGQDL